MITKKIVLFSSFLLFSSTLHAGLYRWIDETGKIHYSDKMPAAVSKKAHSEFNGNGIIKKDVDPEAEVQKASKKLEEKALLEQKTELEKRLKLEAQKRSEEKQKRDQTLLLTYEDKNELVRYFEEKIKRLEGNSHILKSQSTFLIKKITKLEKQKSIIKDETIIKSLDTKIVQIKNNIQQYRKALRENMQEIATINLTFQNDYKRFTELTK